MIEHLINNIPEGGKVTLTLSRNGENTALFLERHFPGEVGLSPLALMISPGDIEEVKAELPRILTDYRRVTNIKAQAEQSIKANDMPAKTTAETKGKEPQQPEAKEKETADNDNGEDFASMFDDKGDS